MKRRRKQRIKILGITLKMGVWQDVGYCFFIMFILVSITINFRSQKLISPISSSYAQELLHRKEISIVIDTISPTSSQEPIVIQNSQQSSIESYIRQIFGSDARIAIAISHAECSPENRSYPRCEAKSNIEHSVGIFQINLYNKSQWIHAARIPGQTMEEKILWLKDPYNNTLYAYWIWSNSGWYPWSTYTSGVYLSNL